MGICFVMKMYEIVFVSHFIVSLINLGIMFEFIFLPLFISLIFIILYSLGKKNHFGIWVLNMNQFETRVLNIVTFYFILNMLLFKLCSRFL